MPRLGYFGIALVICLTLAGCGGGSAQPEFKYRIAVIPKGMTHEFWESIHRGAERAALDLKEQKGIAVQINWDGPMKESESLEQINIINRNIANRVNGIVLAPQHSTNMIAPVEKAVKQNIPVVIIDSGLDNPDLYVKYVATDNYHGGVLAAEYLLKALRDQGKTAPKLILLRYQVGSESTEQREKGFVDTVNKVIEEQRKKGEPTIAWLSTDKYAGATKDSAQRVAEPLLNNLRDQGIDGLFAPNESSASGVLAALRSLGLNKTVHVVGFDSSQQLLQAVEEGNIDALIVQDPYRMSYLGVWTLVHHLEGYNVTPDGNKVQGTGENAITRANLKAQSTRELFEEPMQAQRKMEVPVFPKK